MAGIRGSLGCRSLLECHLQPDFAASGTETVRVGVDVRLLPSDASAYLGANPVPFAYAGERQAS